MHKRQLENAVTSLKIIYYKKFGKKYNQRFKISYSDMRILLGVEKLYSSHFKSLQEIAHNKNLLLIDLGVTSEGHFIGVIKANTACTWRTVPKYIVDKLIVEVGVPDYEGVDDE